MDCKGCVFKLKSFLWICDDQEELIKFLKSHNVIKKSETCGESATFDNCKLKWRCQKKSKVKKRHKIQILCVRSVQQFKKAHGSRTLIFHRGSLHIYRILHNLGPTTSEVPRERIGSESALLTGPISFEKLSCHDVSKTRSKLAGRIVSLKSTKRNSTRENITGDVLLIDSDYLADSIEIRRNYSSFLFRTDQHC